MAGEVRVAWREGLFLRPQHFQQQDQFFDAQLRARAETLRPYPWGLAELVLDEGLASLGKFGIKRCSGVLADGTPFSIPGDLPPPAPIDIGSDIRDTVIYLTLPAHQEGSVEFADRETGGPVVRNLVEEAEVYDTFSNQRTSEPIEVARPNIQFGVKPEQTEGRVRLGLAKVREVHNGRVSLNEDYIPPCLDIRATILPSMLADIIGRATQRVDELAVRAVEATEGGAETFASFLLLQALNRWTPILVHLRNLPVVHPERLYETLSSMAGELATLTRPDRRPPPFPLYDHEDLQGTFEPVIDLLQSALSAMFERSAGQMLLEQLGPGQYTARITDHSLFTTCNFYLAVFAAHQPEELRRQFPRVAKIGSVTKMQKIVQSQLEEGVPIIPAPNPPPQIKLLRGYIYFELDRTAPHWAEFATAPGLGLHVAGDWADLKLELWWVKRSGR